MQRMSNPTLIVRAWSPRQRFRVCREENRHPAFQITLRSFLREFESHFTIAVGIIAPILAHLDEQEKMDRDAGDLGDLLARFRADRLDGGAALAEHDLALAFALDKDRLLDADRIVLALGPAIGLDGGLVR